jgi:hypothetical protein
VTIDERLAPISRMLRMLSTNASPLPSAPSARTLSSTSGDSDHGAGGACPVTSGATIASWTVAQSNRLADSAVPDKAMPARNRFW